MSIFNKDFKPRRTKLKEATVAIFFACLVVILTVLIVAVLPSAIDHALGIRR